MGLAVYICAFALFSAKIAWGNILEAQADFVLQLLKDNGEKSLIISPVSISIGLAMCHVGARGQTATQIANAIAESDSSEEIRTYFSATLSEINSSNKSYILESVNRIYVNKDIDMLDSYRKILINNYRGQFESIDPSQANDAANKINAFVANVTRQKIRDLVSPGMIDSDTKLLVINAIYFKGNWAIMFDKKRTKANWFYQSQDQRKEVQIMQIDEKFPYYEDETIQVVGLPYKNEEAYLYVVLPQKRFGLHGVLQNLTAKKLVQLAQHREKAQVIVELPRFKVETLLSLKNSLQKLGIRDAFSNTANFSGITDDHSVYISSVAHKAFIEVNEEGAEAAAASRFFIKRRMYVQLPKVHYHLKADHPFLYMLVNSSGAIIFSGIFAN